MNTVKVPLLLSVTEPTFMLYVYQLIVRQDITEEIEPERNIEMMSHGKILMHA
jgi:hypothetical protein